MEQRGSDDQLLRELLHVLGLTPEPPPGLPDATLAHSVADTLVHLGWTPPTTATSDGPTEPTEPCEAGETCAVRVEVDRLREALRHRPTTEQAVGMVMMALTCSPQTAWHTLTQLSQLTNRRVRDIAASLAVEVEHGRLDAYRLAAALAALGVVPGA